jgi:hypothetical protein
MLRKAKVAAQEWVTKGNIWPTRTLENLRRLRVRGSEQVEMVVNGRVDRGGRASLCANCHSEQVVSYIYAGRINLQYESSSLTIG